MKSIKFFTIILIITLISGFYSCSTEDAVQKQLEETAHELSKQCPMNIDAFTRMDSVTTQPGKTIVYHYTQVQDDMANVTPEDVAAYEQALKPKLINNMKNGADMKPFRENEVTMIYNYHDQNGKYMTKIELKPADYK